MFLLIAVGFVFAHWKRISALSLTEIIVYLCSPSRCLAHASANLANPGDLAILASGIGAICAGVGQMIQPYFVAPRFHARRFAPPTLFKNAGHMGIPLALFALGETGLQCAMLFFVMCTFLQYSVRIYMLQGRGNWAEIFRLPLIYATLAGLAFNLWQIKLPEILL